MWKSVKMQTMTMLRKKPAALCFFILLALTMVNFISNIRGMQGNYVFDMPYPIKIIILSDWAKYGYYLMQFFPILVVLPACFSLLSDRVTREETFIVSRIGKKKYLYGKIISAFIVTFIIFTLPFLIEILLSKLSFPVNAVGNPSKFQYWQYIKDENKYLMGNIWIYFPYLYGVVQTLLFGLVSASFGVFVVSLTTIPIFKYRVFALLPMYLLFYFIDMIRNIFKIKTEYNVQTVLRMFNTYYVNYLVCTIFIFALIIISVLLIERDCRKDCLT